MSMSKDVSHGQLRQPPVPDLRVRTIQEHGLQSTAGERALASMHGTYTPAILMVTRAILGEALPAPFHTIEDVVQDTWLSVCRGIVEDFERDAPVTPWLKMIARRRSYDAIRAYDTSNERPRSASNSDEKPLRQRPPTVYIPDQEAVDRYADTFSSNDRGSHALIETLDLLAGVRIEQRRILIAYGLGETDQELADQYDLPLGTVKGRIYWGRKAVENLLAEPEAAA